MIAAVSSEKASEAVCMSPRLIASIIARTRVAFACSPIVVSPPSAGAAQGPRSKPQDQSLRTRASPSATRDALEGADQAGVGDWTRAAFAAWVRAGRGEGRP